MNKNPWLRAVLNIQAFLTEPLTFYSIVVALSISSFIVLEVEYPKFVEWTSSNGFYWFQDNYPIFVTSDDKEFSEGFVEWFGVFYGFLLPLLLVRAWEQLDRADREFDREADAIKVLLEDILLLDDSFLELKRNMVGELKDYIEHVFSNYKIEHREPNVGIRNRGNAILQGIRTNYRVLIYRGGGERASHLEPVTTELLDRLNDAIDFRGDRIATFGQRLFETLRMIAIITSVIWLIPFYFLDFQTGVFGSFLKLAVTFLIIFVLTIIADLDEPFNGPGKISIASWLEVQREANICWEELQNKLSEVPITNVNTETSDSPIVAKEQNNLMTLPQLLWTWILSIVYLRLVSPPDARGKQRKI